VFRQLIAPRDGVTHDNYIIVDRKTVDWGSYGHTERTDNKNVENACLRIRSYPLLGSTTLTSHQYSTGPSQKPAESGGQYNGA
jgi:hypothetical protein